MHTRREASRAQDATVAELHSTTAQLRSQVDAQASDIRRLAEQLAHKNKQLDAATGMHLTRAPR